MKMTGETKRQLNMQQVRETGRRVAYIEGENGSDHDIREAAGCLFDLVVSQDGYIRGMYCLGKTARAAREYCINVD